MRPATIKILAIAAAAACAAGLSACQGQVPVPGPSGGDDDAAITEPSAGAPPPDGSDSTGSVEGAQDIEPITFRDGAIGLTETCDQIITDFKAPSYQTGAREYELVYLLHCTLDYSVDLSYEDARTAGVLMLSDDTESGHYGFRTYFVDDDMEAAGLNPINDGNHRGMNHVDGWFSFTVAGSDGRVDPLPEGATTLVYERDALTDSGTGKTYEAYSTRSEVTIK